MKNKILALFVMAVLWTMFVKCAFELFGAKI